MSTPAGKNNRVISRRDAIMGALAVAAGTLVAAQPQAALGNPGDAVIVGNDHYGRSTSFQITSTGLAGGSSLASSFIGRGSNQTGQVMQGLASVLWGTAPTGSAAVWGYAAATNGYGVQAVAANTAGTALRVDGKASFSRSGKATISKGASTKTVTGLVGVTVDSIIIATLQGSAGLGNHIRFVKRLDDTSFKIYLTKAATATTTVGWFILE